MKFPGDILDKEKRKKWSKSSSIKRHDLYNFEAKIDYKYSLEEINKNRKKTSYLLDTYFFIPQSLQINKNSYNKEQFFSDLNNRIRFKTPQMSIEGILDQNNQISPLNVIKRNLKQLEYGNINISITKTIMRELRLLACIVKTTLKGECEFLLENFQSKKKEHELSDILKSHMDSLKEFIGEMEGIRKKIMKYQIPIQLRDSFHYSNEYISLQIEKWFTIILMGLEKQLSRDVQDLIIKFMEKEQAYRESLNSTLTLKEDSSNEEFSYFEGITKKYVQGVLYLKKQRKDPQSSSLQILYSIAAGFAMFISLFLGFLVLVIFELNSLPFIIAMVVVYMLKDRIKDNIKGISQKAVGFVFPDQRNDIVDGFFGEKIGESKEKVNFIEPEKIPSEIIKIRQSSKIRSIEEEGKPEDCLLFRKEIVLFREKIDSL
ncbi:MAG: hypothetical protein ACFFBP_04910, partial [Promethearchaeota archaeon]